MKTDKIRSEFLKFFESKGHKIYPSDSLVPADDLSVLFTSAGMNQFKPYFLGLRKDLKRVATCQKCLRTDDLAKVGKTPAYHTFFEMLGNFSFGDYGKSEAINMAWEFIMGIMKIPESKLWVSVYKDDKEAYDIWTKEIGFPKEKIVKLNADKNFWPADAIDNGPDGPCGPCTEIFFDLGKEYGCKRKNCDPGCSCQRFIEIWNLVFTQFERTKESGKGILKDLPNKNIDTGMGLERIAALMQDVGTNFEIDIFAPLINEIKKIAPKIKKEGNSHINAIADHLRAVVFAISDGVFPSNEERGYVIRKIIRKAYWHGYKIGIDKIFLYRLVPAVVKSMKSAYPELEKRSENIAQIIKSEEEKFQNTLEIGLERLRSIMLELKKKKTKIISGEKVFQLYDTFGFPFELTKEMAEENGFKIDFDSFQKKLETQRQRSKGRSQIDSRIFSKAKDLFGDLSKTEFVGYDKLDESSEVIAIFDSGLKKIINELKDGESGYILVRKTPFYAESGGQTADRGVIESKNFKAVVLNVQPKDGRVLHLIKVEKGKLNIKDKVSLKVEADIRMDTARNHTATHLLQAALRKILGEHVEQSGSYVAPDRLRFDFTHFKALTANEINWVEEQVNKYIMQNDDVKSYALSFKDAKKKGALAFFSDKYQDIVRVIEIGSYSKELCAGTHLKATGEAGLFKIITESSSSSGVRRIEALTGRGAYTDMKYQEEIVKDIAGLLKVGKERLLPQLKIVLDDLSKKEKQAQSQKYSDIDALVIKLKNNASKIKDITFISALVDNEEEFLADLMDRIKIASSNKTVTMLYSKPKGKLKILLGLSADIAKSGADARALVKKISPLIGGGGGGRADFVIAGGKNTSNIDRAIEVVKNELEKFNV